MTKGAVPAPFEALLRACEDAVLLVDAAGNVLRANGPARNLFRQPLGEGVRPLPVRRLFAPCDTRADALLDQLRQHGHARRCITLVRASGDPQEALVSVSCCQDGGEPGAIVVIRQAGVPAACPPDGAGAQPWAVSQQAPPLDTAAEELSRFAPSLAHDLLGPIDTLGGFARALQRTLGDGAPARSLHYLQRILAAVGHLEDHVQALLSLARVSRAPLVRRSTDLTATARAVLKELQLRDVNRSAVATVEDGMRAEGDARLLRIVLENLLGNAWKFSARKPETFISVGTKRACDGTTVYRISDNGDGFDMAYAGKLFLDFQRLHSQSEFAGSGVGLANVRRIVARHGGKVWAEAVPGQGATFYFTLGQ